MAVVHVVVAVAVVVVVAAAAAVVVVLEGGEAVVEREGLARFPTETKKNILDSTRYFKNSAPKKIKFLFKVRLKRIISLATNPAFGRHGLFSPPYFHFLFFFIPPQFGCSFFFSPSLLQQYTTPLL